MTSSQVRVRFPPSPTGLLHVGGLRSALFNWLFARHNHGAFILRIEDTDQSRYDAEALPDLLASLRWLGLDWDEGPEVGGDYGPYYQSERVQIYQEYARKLLEMGKAYYCFCSPERLAELRKQQRGANGHSGYDRHCRDIDPNLAAQRVADGEPAVVRFKMPTDGTTTVHDLIRGDITVENSTQTDVVLLKSDGYPTYHLANVVDDHLMGITHIMRADEWIATAPRHVRLYEAFGWQMPVIAHLPVVLDPSGKGKMSKRKKVAPNGREMPVHVRDFRAAGYLPEAMFNFLARVGWSYDDHTEIMTKEEIIERFTLERIHPAPASFNYDKLDHLNGVYIRRLTDSDLANKLLPFLRQAGIAADIDTLTQIAPLIRERLKRLTDAAEWVDFFFVDELPEYDSTLLIPKKGDAAMACQILTKVQPLLGELSPFEEGKLEEALRKLADEMGLKAGQVFAPVRAAVSGKAVSPPLFGTIVILGRRRTMDRINLALSKLRPLAS